MKKKIAKSTPSQLELYIYTHIPFSMENLNDPLNDIHRLLDRLSKHKNANSNYMLNLKNFEKISKPITQLFDKVGEEIFNLMLTNPRNLQTPLTRCPNLKNYLEIKLNIVSDKKPTKTITELLKQKP
jgi:hypothetical protein